MDENKQTAKVKTGAIRWLVRETLGNLILLAMLFGIVGYWDWWNGWAMSATYLLWTAGSIIFILPVNPQMLAERSRPQPGSKKWDMFMVGTMGIFVLITYVIACLDVRFGWAQPFPLWVQVAGVVVAVFGYDILLIWSMAANAFFTAIVRIQTDRQHTVVSSGPYRFVRHPGYVAALLFYLATPFLLGSTWSVLPALLTAIVLVIRTALEDKTLQAELPGYREYAGRVRFRLLPGVW